MTDLTTQDDLLSIPGHWNFEYNYFAGATASRFFRELRDRRIMGTTCDGCDRTLVPARAYCDACFRPTDEWVEIGNRGTLDAFTIIAVKFPGLPDPPLVIGYATLEGADTALVNYVTGIDLDDLETAAAALMQKPTVEVVFSEEPQGRITDFHFRLTDSSDSR